MHRVQHARALGDQLGLKVQQPEIFGGDGHVGAGEGVQKLALRDRQGVGHVLFWGRSLAQQLQQPVHVHAKLVGSIHQAHGAFVVGQPPGVFPDRGQLLRGRHGLDGVQAETAEGLEGLKYLLVRVFAYGITDIVDIAGLDLAPQPLALGVDGQR